MALEEHKISEVPPLTAAASAANILSEREMSTSKKTGKVETGEDRGKSAITSNTNKSKAVGETVILEDVVSNKQVVPATGSKSRRSSVSSVSEKSHRRSSVSSVGEKSQNEYKSTLTNPVLADIERTIRCPIHEPLTDFLDLDTVSAKEISRAY